MANIARSSLASMDINQAVQVVAGLMAGEALDAVAPCYIKSSDGLVYQSDGTAANEKAEVIGFTPRAVAIGQPVTLFGVGTRFKYSDSLLTPGDVYYVSATAGALDAAPTTGDTYGVALALTATDILIFHTSPVVVATVVGAGTVNAAALSADAVETAKILNLNVTAAKMALGAAGEGIDERMTRFNLADAVVGSLPIIHRVAIAAGVAGTKNVTLTYKFRILDVWVIMKGAGVALCTLTVGNVANIVTDAMDVSGADGVIVHAASLVTAFVDITAGTALRIITAVAATQPDCEVCVLGVRVA